MKFRNIFRPKVTRSHLRLVLVIALMMVMGAVTIAVTKWDPDNDWSGITYFKPGDFVCKGEGCCLHEDKISMELVKRLDWIRSEIDLPVVVLSGYRCPVHNMRVRGVEDSAHTRGFAADIKCSDNRFRYLFLLSAMKYLRRIGIGDGFIHVDCDSALPQDVVWVYYK